MASDARIETAGQALRGVFGDPAWLKKVLLGAGVNLIPYLGAVWLMGYGLHYQRAVALGTGQRLPEWSDFQPQAKTGLFAFVVGLAYSLPLSIVLGVLMVVAVAAGVFSVAATEEVVWLFVWIVVVFGVAMAVGLAFGLILWPVYVHVELHDTIEAGFRLKEILATVKAHAATYWTAVRRSIALGLLSMSIVLLFLGVGVAAGALVGLSSRFEELFAFGALLITPFQLVAGVLISVISIPITLATNRVWGQYASVAYGLGPGAGDQADAVAPEV